MSPNSRVNELIDYINRVSEKSALQIDPREWNKRISKQTVEEARLPITIPSPPKDGVDEAIMAIIETISVEGPNSPKTIGSRLNAYAQSRFLEYATWRAILAIRNQSADLIRQGLTALAIEGGKREWTASVVVLAMLYNSAVKLGMDADKIFADVALLAESGVIQKEMSRFPHRSPHDRSLEAFFLLEEITEEGFVYKHIPWWMKFPQRTR
jgi:hypothetical protein